MKSIGAGVSCFGLFLALSAGAVPDGGAVPDSGTTPCKTSDDCSPPTAYCHPTRQTCVQCISNVNCFGIALVCNTDKGVCATCASNADCYYPAPYCNTGMNACVACLTDANCGKQGIKCKDGVCGSCGDGICSDNERNGVEGICKDCFDGCPKSDLGTKIGDKVASGQTQSTNPVGTVAPLVTQCGPGGTPDSTFAWTAPKSGSYLVSAGLNAYVAVLADDCAGAPFTCWTDTAYVSLAKGQKVAILVIRSDMTSGPYSLSITNLDGSCNPMFCPPGQFGEPACCMDADAGGCGIVGPSGCVSTPMGQVNPLDVKTCYNGVATRGEQMCMESTDCRCNSCPLAFDNCSNLDGCRQIVQCMHRYACISSECDTPDRCGPTIDAYGGLGSLAFSYAAALNACDYMSGCRDCRSADLGDASLGSGGIPGAAGSFSGTGNRVGFSGSAGRSTGTGGTPGTEVDGGVDSKGSSPSSSDGCDCSVPRSGTSGSAALSAVAGLLAMAGLRRRRRG